MPVNSPQQRVALSEYRAQFPHLSSHAYFNYGGQGPMPQAAFDAIAQAHDDMQKLGPFSISTNTWITQETEATRRAIAAELAVAPETISITEDVSVGCNIGLWGIDWQAGDHVLLSDCEHPGIIAAVQELQYRFGLEISTCPLMATLNGGDPVAVVQSHLKPNTRLLVVSHILWNTGQVLPLTEIVTACHGHRGDRPVHVLVDAAQSVGVLPLNLAETGVDFYAFTGHKWWCGPAGVGALYVSPEAQPFLRPTFIGWRGIFTDATGTPTGMKPDGRRYEVATSAVPLYAGLRAALALHSTWGTGQERYQRICQLSGYLWEKLAPIPGLTRLRTAPPEAGLVSFQLENQTHIKVVQALEKQGFLVRTILNPDCIRACVHYLTLESEIDGLVAALSALST